VKPAMVLVVVAVAVAGGYLVGARARSSTPPVTKLSAPAETRTEGASPIGVPADCQDVRNKLAICMAYHPPESEQDKQLAMCRGDLAAARSARPTLPSCYDFADAAATYDRELGEDDPSPETIEQAARLTAEDCGAVLEWSSRAYAKQATCLSGETPKGWKERYGRSISARPFVKACNAEGMKRDATNAWFRFQEDRARDMGHDGKPRIRMMPDGGYRVSTPLHPLPDD
jgi:hypothetical protein